MSVYIDTELSIPLGLQEKAVLSFFKTIGGNYDCFLDVGGYIGAYSVLFSAVTGQYSYVVEPHPNNQMRIRENIEVNNLCDKIHLVEAAATDHVGESELQIGSGGSSHSLTGNSTENESLTVSTTTIDIICKKYSITPDLVKIDVEGGGSHVLDGAEELLRSSETDWLIELHGKDEGKPMIDAFENNGYVLRKLDEHNNDLDEGGHIMAFANKNN